LFEHRLQSPFAEVDLVFFDSRQKTYQLVEVKTLSSWAFAENRVSRKQSSRLHKARSWLEGVTNTKARLHLALVEETKAITWFSDFLS